MLWSLVIQTYLSSCCFIHLWLKQKALSNAHLPYCRAMQTIMTAGFTTQRKSTALPPSRKWRSIHRAVPRQVLLPWPPVRRIMWFQPSTTIVINGFRFRRFCGSSWRLWNPGALCKDPETFQLQCWNMVVISNLSSIAICCFDSVNSFNNVYLMSPDSSVVIATAYCLDGLGIWVRFSAQARDLFLHSIRPCSGSQPAYPVGTRGNSAEG